LFRKEEESQIRTLEGQTESKVSELLRLREENEILKIEIKMEKKKTDEQKTNTRSKLDKTKQLAAKTTDVLTKELANTQEELLKYKKDIVPSLNKEINRLKCQGSRR